MKLGWIKLHWALDASPKPDRAIEADDLLFIMGENKFVSRVVELD